MTHQPPGFIERLKRRHVFRVTAIYAAIAWILIQMFSIVLPDLGVSKDNVRILIVALALGFPLMLVLGWMLVPPAKVSRVELSHWKRWRWRLGPPLSLAIAAFVVISGWYLWQINGRHPLAAAQTMTSPQGTAPQPVPDSIAVLPFANLSSDASQQYFGDGIAQELAVALGQVPTLRVMAWQSSAVYHGNEVPPQTAGQHLGVANVLTGSVMRENAMVRVTVSLINTVTGFQLWSAHFDRPLQDVFAIQDDISRSVVAALRGPLGNNAPLIRQATAKPEAHDAYLRGLSALGLRTPEHTRRAILYFEQAIALDDRYAEAYVELARAYVILPEITAITVQAANAKALPALRQALAVNPDLSSAHSVLGVVYFSEKKAELARAELLRALALNPNDALARTYYAYLLPLKDAVAQFEQAALLDPDSWAIRMNLGSAYAGTAQYESALEAYSTAQRLAPENPDAYLETALLQHLRGNDDAAIGTLDAVASRNPDKSGILKASRLTYRTLHDARLRPQTLTTLDRLNAEQAGTFTQYYVATAYALLGENAKAIKAAAGFCAAIPDSCNDIALDPHYLPLRADPDFQQLAIEYNIKR